MLRSFVSPVRRLATKASSVIYTSPFNEPLLKSDLMKKSYPSLLLEDMTSAERSHLVAGVDGMTGATRTYQQTHDSTVLTAAALVRLGVKKGDVVAIASPNHINFFSAFQGIALTGAASTPINPSYTYEEMLFQCTKTKAKVILAHPACLERAFKVATSLKLAVVSMDDDPANDTHGKLAAKMTEWVKGDAKGIDKMAFPAMQKTFDSDATMTLPFR